MSSFVRTNINVKFLYNGSKKNLISSKFGVFYERRILEKISWKTNSVLQSLFNDVGFRLIVFYFKMIMLDPVMSVQLLQNQISVCWMFSRFSAFAWSISQWFCLNQVIGAKVFDSHWRDETGDGVWLLIQLKEFCSKDIQAVPKRALRAARLSRQTI